jgi:hypothetical protein
MSGHQDGDIINKQMERNFPRKPPIQKNVNQQDTVICCSLDRALSKYDKRNLLPEDGAPEASKHVGAS